MNENESEGSRRGAAGRHPILSIWNRLLAMPGQRMRAVLLTFNDADAENGYRKSIYREHRLWITIAPLLALIMNLGFFFLDKTLVAEEVRDLYDTVRIGVIGPVCVAGFVAALVVRDYRKIIPIYGLGYAAIGLCWTLLLIHSGPTYVDYLSWAIAQTALFACVLLGLPFAWSLPLVTTVAVFYLGTAVVLLDDRPIAVNVVLGVGTILTLALLAAYRYEKTSRQAFLAEARQHEEYQLRLSSERDRSQWLGTIAGFVRHELKNAIAGVGSSLELAARGPLQPKTQDYLARASHRLDFMRQFLQKVADATSLEDALRLQETEVVDLSELVAGSLDDFRDSSSNVAIVDSIQPNLHILGSPDSLVQALDKLLNNALEHSDPGRPVSIVLTAQAGFAVLVIEDNGDPLPKDAESIFQPFVSSKPKGATGNLGLGLYVAKIIVSHHRGSIVAESLDEPIGARFTITLPLMHGDALQPKSS